MRAAARRQRSAAHPGNGDRDDGDSRRFVERTCTEITFGGDAPASAGPSPLAAFRPVPAYVLLGDPGAGKTTEFRRECRGLGDAAAYVKARDFISLDLDSHPEWKDRTLFIDGLDEMRAGAADARIPLDEIRNRLDRLGRPSFRISCREADWLGPNDRQSLQAVSPDSTIRVLLLDELSEKATRELLAEVVGIDNASAFEHEARRRGLGAMLRNPQSLLLLTKAVAPGCAWPDSRLETHELACRRMAAECNDEHQHGAQRHPTEIVLDAAGHLCALLLLCGFEGYELASGGLAADSGPQGLVPLDDLGDATLVPALEAVKAALGTNLFSLDGETGRVPSHRLIAEFLAGCHLAEAIDGGLPARRAVALMRSPADGRVATVLRGLSAWLAARSGEARRELIDADPVGVGLYGDIGGFSLQDRERLLRSLVEFAVEGPLFGHARQDDRALGYGDDTARAFRSLASADMMEAIRSLLRAPVGQPQRDRTTAFVLAVLSEAEEPQKESLIPLVPELRTIIRDPDRPPWVTGRALDAYIHIVPPSDEAHRALVGFLDAIHAHSIPDAYDSLREALLKHLYPEVIGPAGVWRYALPRPRHAGVNRLGGFWDWTILQESSDRHVSELLDALSEDTARLIPALTESHLEDLPVQLLARGLRAAGDTLGIERLLDWLDAAGKVQRTRHHRTDDARAVRAWLENRPRKQKSVFLAWLRREVTRDPDKPYRHWFCDALHRSRLPTDFGLWCFDQAVTLEDGEPALARELLTQAYVALDDPSIREGLTFADMRDRIGTGVLAGKLEELHSRRSAGATEDDDWWQQAAEHRKERTAMERRRREEWAKNLRAELDDLRNDRFVAPNLHTLAQVYLGIAAYGGQPTSPQQRIHDFIGGDEVIVDAVMAAIRGAVWRGDVPEVDETVALHLDSKHSWLAYPVLASLALLNTEDPARLDEVSADRKRRALAIHYCVPSGNESPDWHERWFRQAPELVLEVLRRCAVPALQAGEEYVPCLDILARLGGYDDSAPVWAFGDGGKLVEARSPTPRFDCHDDLIHTTRLRLLDSFPSRASNKQMGLLDDLLARVLQHPDRTTLRELARRKLSLRSLGIGQRTRWLAVDALLAGGTDLTPLKEYVGGNEARVRHLAQFLHRTSRRDDMGRSVLADTREPEVLQDAIEILGPWFPPARWGESGFITLGMEMSDLISSLIEQLGAIAGDRADRAFVAMIDDPRLERWHDRLVSAHERQRVVNRDASYRHPGIKDVQRTLTNGAPANAADLAALLVDRLQEISGDVRGGSTNLWRQFWNEDSHGRPTDSKPENSCRDALLATLRMRLPSEVDATPESNYAADNRADVRASCTGFNIPMEIKKNSHADLWTAIRRQLIGKYTTDPATCGYGVYLVLWFGANATKTPPDGNRPGSPEELKQHLEQDLTADEARKISVIVMDVTKPDPP